MIVNSMIANGKIHIYRTGLVHCSVCVPVELTPREIEHEVNDLYPTGIEAKWHIAEDKTFSGGQPNPCVCEDAPGRLHYLMTC